MILLILTISFTVSHQEEEEGDITLEEDLRKTREDLASYQAMMGCEMQQVLQDTADQMLPPGVKARRPVLKYAYYCKLFRVYKLNRRRQDSNLTKHQSPK